MHQVQVTTYPINLLHLLLRHPRRQHTRHGRVPTALLLLLAPLLGHGLLYRSHPPSICSSSLPRATPRDLPLPPRQQPYTFPSSLPLCSPSCNPSCTSFAPSAVREVAHAGRNPVTRRAEVASARREERAKTEKTDERRRGWWYGVSKQAARALDAFVSLVLNGGGGLRGCSGWCSAWLVMRGGRSEICPTQHSAGVSGAGPSVQAWQSHVSS